MTYKEVAEKLNYNVNDELDKLKLFIALHDVCQCDLTDTGVETYYTNYVLLKQEFKGLDIDDFVEFVKEFQKLHNVAFFDGLRNFMLKELD